VQVPAPAPHTMGRLPAVSPDVAKLLAVMALREFTQPYMQSTLMEMWQRLFRLKISCNFADLGKVIRNKGRFLVIVPSEGDRRVVVICLTLTMSNPRVTSPSEISSAGVLGGR
jgi:hypothetical protein